MYFDLNQEVKDKIRIIVNNYILEDWNVDVEPTKDTPYDLIDYEIPPF